MRDFQPRRKTGLLLRVESAKISSNRASLGIARIFLVVVIVVILLVAGAGIYFLVISNNSGTSVTTQSSHSTATTSSRTTTSTKSVVSLRTSATSTSRSSSSVSSGVTTYTGTFNFSQPLGPSGERVLSNYTVQTYSSTQVGSGSFTFFISALNQSGTGSGQGTLVVTTTGFCSGTVTVPYTFTIPDATTLLGNLTVFFSIPTPANFMVPLSCTGPMGGVDTSTNNPLTFLAVYPNEISLGSVPGTVTQHLSGNVSYSYTIT